MNHKNNKRAESTKNKIKSALVSMLKVQDLNKITVRALCEHANINRSTFYNHYSSTESILKSIEKDMASTLTSFLSNAAAMDNTVSKHDILHDLYSNILHFIKENLEVCVVLSDSFICPNFANALLQDPVIINSFPHAMSETYEEEDTDYMRTFLFYGSFHIMDRWIQKGCDRSPEEIAELITNIMAKF